MNHGYNPFDLQGQQRDRLKDAERSKQDAQVETDDIRWLMGSKRGRRIVWRLLERTGVFRSSFTGNSETFFREGMRNVGLMLLASIHTVGPELYAEMVKEHQEHGRQRNADNGTT